MDEESIEQSLELYRTQLSQVEQAIQAAGETEDLVKLKTDLTELIDLTQDSLLSLKKSQLLASLEASSPSSTNAPASTNTAVDDEYAAFQAALGGDAFSTQEDTSSASNDVKHQPQDSEEEEDDDENNDSTVAESFSELVGMKCRAPFSHDWGGLSYHNALVFKVEENDSSLEMPKVRVMFCNPTHISMLPCSFFLDGRCKFDEDKCKYSHGYLMKIEDLGEYQEPDYSHVVVGGKCFARYSDDVWHAASIVDVDDSQVTVIFTHHGNQETVNLHDVLPLEGHDDGDSDESNDEEPSTSSGYSQPINREDSESDDELPVFLWKPPKTTAALGEWEEHTRGIASKLMKKMGYVTGQGLGVRGEGRAEPVPIQLLPQGKSLDKIMELKEIAGDRDLFDAMKKLKKKKKKEEMKKTSSTQESASPANVFDFINKKLRGKKGNLSDLVHHQGNTSSKSESKRHIAESDLNQRSDRHLNIQALKTCEEIRRVEKELQRLRTSHSRNKDRDKSAALRIQNKITSTEAYLDKLKSSEQVLEKHKQKRSDTKKLSVF